MPRVLPALEDSAALTGLAPPTEAEDAAAAAEADLLSTTTAVEATVGWAAASEAAAAAAVGVAWSRDSSCCVRSECRSTSCCLSEMQKGRMCRDLCHHFRRRGGRASKIWQHNKFFSTLK